jgi:hypothetical protein
MKYSVLTLLMVILLGTSCKKHAEQPQNPLAALPAPTRTGARTFGCLINGQALVARNRNLLEGPLISAYYNGQYLTLSGGNKNSDGSITSILIATDSLSITAGQSIGLATLLKGGTAGASYDIFSKINTVEYKTSAALTGLLTITRFDSGIVSGTFYFNALNSSGDTVKVTNGRFDLLL